MIAAASPVLNAFIGAGAVVLVGMAGAMIKLVTQLARNTEHLEAVDRALDRIERHLRIGGRDRGDDT